MNSEDLTQVLMLVYQVLLPSELSSLAFKMGDVAIRFPGQQRDSSFRSLLPRVGGL